MKIIEEEEADKYLMIQFIWRVPPVVLLEQIIGFIGFFSHPPSWPLFRLDVLLIVSVSHLIKFGGAKPLLSSRTWMELFCWWNRVAIWRWAIKQLVIRRLPLQESYCFHSRVKRMKKRRRRAGQFVSVIAMNINYLRLSRLFRAHGLCTWLLVAHSILLLRLLLHLVGEKRYTRWTVEKWKENNKTCC